MTQLVNQLINESQMAVLPENLLGSDCSGTDGTADRTLTLAVSSINSITVLTVNGSSLHEGAAKDFTVSGNVVTFLNVIDDTDNIRVVYSS